MSKSIILTFDVEEWFHTTFMTKYIPVNLLEESRVEHNISMPLELLAKYDIPATFFVLGELAQSKPKVIKKIVGSNAQHEIASHAYHHELIFEQSDALIEKNVVESKKCLEDLSGRKIKGFRAPYFSINDYAIEKLIEAGYEYDSSLHDFRLNPQYGHLTVGMEATSSPGIFHYNGIHEVTIPVKRYLKFLKFPFGGGGYFRLYPLTLQHYWIRSFLKSSDYFLMYMHPWEFDNEQPYIKQAPYVSRKRHYLGIKNHYNKTEKLITRLKDDGYNFVTMSEYLSTLRD
ncbi:MAG: polysaccharide deacetylase family protein [Candidatus Dojkabacteria bacterium]